MSFSDEKYAIFNVEGGLGKIIASTAIAEIIKNNYPDRKLIVVTPWPEPYLNNPYVYRVFRSGNHPYFYKDFVLNKDTIIFKGEPYFTSDHIQKKKHIILSWCDLFGLKYNGERSQLFFNPVEVTSVAMKYGTRPKPILILQTSGGLYQNQKPYCWTRDIPPVQAQMLANILSQKYHIYHIGRPNSYKLQNVEFIPEINKRELMSLNLSSAKRLVIDSCMQHAAAALGLHSTVLWIGTSHINFGYTFNNNIYPSAEKTNEHLIDSFIFDYAFDGFEHEYPFSTMDIFNIDEIVRAVG